MARDRSVHEELAVHRVRNISGPEKPQHLLMDERGIGPAIAAEAVRLAGGGQRTEAVKNINNILKAQIRANQIVGHPCSSMAEIAELDIQVEDGRVVLSPPESDTLNELRWIRWEAMDGMAVATVAVLSGNSELSAIRDDPQKIEEVLEISGESVGLGAAIGECIVADPKLRKRLDIIQQKIEGGAFDNGIVVSTLTRIDELYANGEVNEEEAKMLMAYLSSIIGAEVAEKAAVEERKMAMTSAQEEYAAWQLNVQKKAEANSYADWLSTILSKTGQIQPAGVWSVEAPKWFIEKGPTDWHDFLDLVTSMHNKVMTRRAALGAAKNIGTAYYDASYPKVTERSMSLAYGDVRTGLRDALELIARDLYIETITEEVGGELVVREISHDEKAAGIKGQFVMKYDVVDMHRNQVRNQEGAKLMAAKGEGGRRAYVLRAAKELEKKLGGKGVDLGDQGDHSKMAVSMALDFLELGFGIDATDHQRRVNSAVEAARTNCRPGYKLGSKTEGGEVMLSAWVAYYQERYEDDITQVLEKERLAAAGKWSEEIETSERNRLVAEMMRRDGLIPQVLCGSILDLEFNTTEGKMSLGRALQSKSELLFNPESTEDVLFPVDKWFENASGFWAYVSSAEKLSFKGDLKEVDAVIVDFAKGLNNAYSDLRSKGMVDVHDLVAAIGGAAGLIPSDPPVLNVPIHNIKLPYSFIGSQILNHMPALSANERRYVNDYFGFDSRFARAAPELWASSLDPRMSEGDRRFFKDVLRNTGSSSARSFRRGM